MGRFENKVAVISGAATGIGSITAVRFAEEGASLVLGDINSDALEVAAAAVTEAGGRVVQVVGDLTEEAAAEELISKAIEAFGQIDILVNNIGGLGSKPKERAAKIWEMNVEDWDYVLRLNLRPTFLCTRFALPHMMKRNQGRVICISSNARLGTPWLAEMGCCHYSAGKAALDGFIRDIALELGEHNITINCVAPGPTTTEIASPELEKWEKTLDIPPVKLVPMKRYGQPVEIANGVLFMASDEASYTTGHTLCVTGGR